jgi:hypothetical protein
MTIFRRGRLAIAIAVDVKEIVLDFDLSRFGEMYEHVKEFSDFTFKLEWFRLLMFVDCLLCDQDFVTLEHLILHEKSQSDERLMQGVCLRLEQIVVTYKGKDLQISNGALKLLNDISSCHNGIVQRLAHIVLTRLYNNGYGMNTLFLPLYFMISVSYVFRYFLSYPPSQCINPFCKYFT